MKMTRNWISLFMLAALATLGAPSSIAQGFADSRRAESSSPIADEALGEELVHKLGESLARSLAEPQTRQWLADHLAASVYVEKRIAFKRVLKQQPELGSSLLEQAGVPVRSWASADALLPELELYFPFPEHLTGWKRAKELEVAVKIGETGTYRVYSSTGPTLTVGEDYQPAVPTLVLGHSEIDYDDLPSAVIGGTRTGAYLLSLSADSAGNLASKPQEPTSAGDRSVNSVLRRMYVGDNREKGGLDAREAAPR